MSLNSPSLSQSSLPLQTFFPTNHEVARKSAENALFEASLNGIKDRFKLFLDKSSSSYLDPRSNPQFIEDRHNLALIAAENNLEALTLLREIIVKTALRSKLASSQENPAKGIWDCEEALRKALEPTTFQKFTLDFQILLLQVYSALLESILAYCAFKVLAGITKETKDTMGKTIEAISHLNTANNPHLKYYQQLAIEAIKRLKDDQSNLEKTLKNLTTFLELAAALYHKEIGNAAQQLLKLWEEVEIKRDWYETVSGLSLLARATYTDPKKLPLLQAVIQLRGEGKTKKSATSKLKGILKKKPKDGNPEKKEFSAKDRRFFYWAAEFLSSIALEHKDSEVRAFALEGKKEQEEHLPGFFDLYDYIGPEKKNWRVRYQLHSRCSFFLYHSNPAIREKASSLLAQKESEEKHAEVRSLLHGIVSADTLGKLKEEFLHLEELEQTYLEKKEALENERRSQALERSFSREEAELTQLETSLEEKKQNFSAQQEQFLSSSRQAQEKMQVEKTYLKQEWEQMEEKWGKCLFEQKTLAARRRELEGQNLYISQQQELLQKAQEKLAASRQAGSYGLSEKEEEALQKEIVSLQQILDNFRERSLSLEAKEEDLQELAVILDENEERLETLNEQHLKETQLYEKQRIEYEEKCAELKRANERLERERQADVTFATTRENARLNETQLSQMHTASIPRRSSLVTAEFNVPHSTANSSIVNAEFFYSQAQTYYAMSHFYIEQKKRGYIKKAAVSYEQALELYPPDACQEKSRFYSNHLNTYKHLANAYLELGDYTQALATWDKLLAKKLPFPSPHFSLVEAKIHLLTEKPEKAFPSATEFLEQYPSSTGYLLRALARPKKELFLVLSDEASALLEHQKALLSFSKKTLSSKPSLPSSPCREEAEKEYKHAIQYLEQDDLSEKMQNALIEHLFAALKNDPSHQEAYHTLLKVLTLLEHTEKLNQLGFFYIKNHDYAKAQECLEISLSKGNSVDLIKTLFYIRGMQAYEQQDLAKTKECFSFLTSSSLNHDAYLILGKIALEKDALDEAENSFKLAWAASVDSKEACSELAYCYVKRKKYEELFCEQPLNLSANTVAASIPLFESVFDTPFTSWNTLLRGLEILQELDCHYAKCLSSLRYGYPNPDQPSNPKQEEILVKEQQKLVSSRYTPQEKEKRCQESKTLIETHLAKSLFNFVQLFEKIEPTPQERLRLAKLSVYFQKKELAQSHLDTLLKKDPQNFSLHLLQAELYSGDGEKALSHLTSLQLEKVQDPQIQSQLYQYLGQAYYASHKPQEALLAYDPALKGTTQPADLYYQMALAAKQVEPERELSYLKEAVKHAPHLPAFTALITLLLQHKKEEEAYTYQKEALQYAPFHPLFFSAYLYEEKKNKRCIIS